MTSINLPLIYIAMKHNITARIPTGSTTFRGCMAAMLVNRNSKNHFSKNRDLFPKKVGTGSGA